MIFKLDGGIENLLALTPVLVEWRKRNGPPVRVETLYPEVFRGNPYVDEAARRIKAVDSFFDLNIIAWHKLIKLVTESYAERILGDTNLSDWRPLMTHTVVENVEAKRIVVDPKTASVCFDEEMMEEGIAGAVQKMLSSKGYSLADVSPGKQVSVGVQRAVISNSAIFVGTDGPAAAIAFTTDVPAVVCYSYRDPCYFMPFRRGQPFSAILPTPSDCDMLRICLAQNSFSEYGKLYGHVCQKTSPFACKKVDFKSRVEEAVEKVLAKA